MAIKSLAIWIIGGLILYHFLKNNREGMSSSRGTLIQLSAATSSYPFWMNGRNYNYPEYRYMMPYYDYSTQRSSNMTFPKPKGYYINY